MSFIYGKSLVDTRECLSVLKQFQAIRRRGQSRGWLRHVLLPASQQQLCLPEQPRNQLPSQR